MIVVFGIVPWQQFTLYFISLQSQQQTRNSTEMNTYRNNGSSSNSNIRAASYKLQSQSEPSGCFSFIFILFLLKIFHFAKLFTVSFIHTVTMKIFSFTGKTFKSFSLLKCMLFLFPCCFVSPRTSSFLGSVLKKLSDRLLVIYHGIFTLNFLTFLRFLIKEIFLILYL